MTYNVFRGTLNLTQSNPVQEDYGFHMRIVHIYNGW